MSDKKVTRKRHKVTELSGVGEALQKTEAIYSNLVERCNDGIIVIQDGMLKFANSRMLEMSGFSESEVLGKPFLNFVAPEWRGIVADRYKKRMSGEEVPEKYEIEIVSKDGRKIAVEVNASIIEYDGKQADMAIVRDITERKQMDEVLKRVASEWQTTFNSTRDLIMVLDAEWKIVRANLATSKFFQVDLKEIIGENCYTLMHGTSSPYDMCPLKKTKETKQSEQAEIFVPNRGLWVWVSTDPILDDKANLVGVVHIVRDITQRKQMDEALKKSEERYRKLIAASPDGIAFVDIAGLITYASPKLAKLFGYQDESEIIGCSPLEWVVPEEREIARTNIGNILKEGYLGRNQYRLLKKDRTLFWGEINSSALNDDKGNPIGLIAIIHDITERKQMELQLQSVNRLYALLSDINEAIVKIKERDELFQTVCKIAVETGKFRMAWVGLVDQKSGTIKPVTYYGHEEGFLNAIHFNVKDPVLAGTPSASAIREGKLITIDNIEAGGIVPQRRVESLKRGYRSVAVVPLKLKGKFIANFTMYAEKPEFFTDEERGLLQEIGEDISFALDTIETEAGRKQAEEALRQSEEKFYKAFHLSPEAITITSVKDGRFFEVNEALLCLSGYTREETLNRTSIELNLWAYAEDRDRYVAALQKHGGVRDQEFRFRTKSGEIRDCLVSGEFIHLKDEPYILGVIRDVTEQKRTSYALLRTNRALKVLSICNEALVHATEEISLLPEICRVIIEVGGYKIAWVGYAEQDEKKTVRPVAQAGYEEEYLQTVKITWDDTEHGRGPTGKAIKTGKPTICTNFQTDPDYAPWRDEAVKRGYQSSIALPLIHHKQVFGTLNIYSAEVDAFDTDEIALLAQLANDLAYGITALREQKEHVRAEEELQLRELRFSQFFNNNPEYSYMVSPEGMILDVNKAALRALGYDKEELVGKPLQMICATECLSKFKENFARWQETGELKDAEITIITKEGKRRTVLVSAGAIRDKQGKILSSVSVHKDITELRQAEKDLKESEARYRTLYQTAAEGIVITDVETKQFKYLNPAICKMLGYTEAELMEKGIRGIHPEDSLEFVISEYEAKARGEKTLSLDIPCLRKDGAVIYVDINTAVALIDGRKCTTSFFTDVTQRKLIEEERVQNLEKLAKAVEGSINAIAFMSETRDPYTAGHQQRVAKLAVAIAKEMCLSQEQVETIRVAGILHDVGKMQVPAEILSKPGKLSQIEMGLVKVHPRVGREILKMIDMPWPACPIVLQHHERLDGSGYPDGLSGEKIVLGARILAVADVVEAMASHRPYRPALGIDKALEEISQNRGTLYDADVVDACLRLFREKGFKLE